MSIPGVTGKFPVIRIKTWSAKDLLAACGQTQQGKDAFNHVIKLALEARRRLNGIASQAINASDNAKAEARAKSQTIIDEFNSISGAILGKVITHDHSFKISHGMTLDDLCNFKAR